MMHHLHRALLVLTLGALSFGCAGGARQAAEVSVKDALSYAHDRHLENARTHDPADGSLRRVIDGQWETTRPQGWTSGFFPGILWMLYDYSGDQAMLEQARRWTDPLEVLRTYTGNHDLGFMVYNPFGHGYRLTGDEAYHAVILDAANALASRYNPDVGVIRSWDHGDWTYPVIIDNMMNLELLFWAAENGGDASLYDLAVSHALRSRQEHVRPDGSTFHVIDFDPATGEVVGRETHQGYADESTWARGQAWAIYGFTMTYRETEDFRFLETAERLADWFVANLPEDHVPYWDFDAPDKENAPRDASAAAIAASGLLELSNYATEAGKQDRYRNTAANILRALSSPRYLTRGTDNPAVLLHSVGNLPGDSEVDIPIIYADYYFIEALLRMMGRYAAPLASS